MRLIYGTLRWLASIIDSDGQNNNRVSRHIDWRVFDATAQNTSSLSVETASARQVENTSFKQTTGVHGIMWTHDLPALRACWHTCYVSKMALSRVGKYCYTPVRFCRLILLRHGKDHSMKWTRSPSTLWLYNSINLVLWRGSQEYFFVFRKLCVRFRKRTPTCDWYFPRFSSNAFRLIPSGFIYCFYVILKS